MREAKVRDVINVQYCDNFEMLFSHIKLYGEAELITEGKASLKLQERAY